MRVAVYRGITYMCTLVHVAILVHISSSLHVTVGDLAGTSLSPSPAHSASLRECELRRWKRLAPVYAFAVHPG